MADTKGSALPVAATLADTDRVYVVTDPAGTPASETAAVSTISTATVGKSGVLIGASGVCKEDTLGGLVVDSTRGVRPADEAANYGGNLTVSASFIITWRSGANWFTGSDDTGLARSAAGVLKVTDGGAGSSQLLAAGFRISALQTPPASATATGTVGEIRFGTDGFLYLCTATDTWIRVALATW